MRGTEIQGEVQRYSKRNRDPVRGTEIQQEVQRSSEPYRDTVKYLADGLLIVTFLFIVFLHQSYCYCKKSL